MVFMKMFSMGKKMLGGGGKKAPAPKAAAAAAPAADKLKGESARATKELLTPVRSARKPIRMRAGARKAMGRGSSRSGGR